MRKLQVTRVRRRPRRKPPPRLNRLLLGGPRVQLALRDPCLHGTWSTICGTTRIRESVSSGRPCPLTTDLALTTTTGLTLSFFLTVVNQFVLWFSLPLLAAAVAYSMFWLPQIVRSALRGRTAALTTEYLVGTTICRLLFAICLYSGISVFVWADSNPLRLPGLQ